MNCLLLKKDRSALKKLLIWKAAGGGGPAPQTETVVGTEVSFITSKARPLVDCYVDFFPVQEGSGDPSPENVRQISGWNGISVYLSPTASGGTEYPVSWQTAAGTVYGGTVDLVNGLLIATYRAAVIDGTTPFEIRNSGRYVIINNADMLSGSHYEDPNTMCDKVIKASGSSSVEESILSVLIGANDTKLYFYHFNTALGITTSEAVKDWFAQHPVTYTYPLASPERYQVDPTVIRTLIGTNYIRNNADGEMTVTYIY